MPGLWLPDTGHKALCPVSAAAVPLALPAASAASLEVRVVRPDMDTHARFRLHARGLSLSYTAGGCPWEAPRPLGTGTKMRLREKAGRPRRPALLREPHMEADSAACVDP